jgi:hypothetical protein
VVERTEQAGHVFFADAHFEVLASLEEFNLGESSTIVVIHNRENSLQSNHAPGTSRLQFVLEKSKQIVGRIMSRLLEINLLTLFFLNVWVDAGTMDGDCILFRGWLLSKELTKFLEVEGSISADVVLLEDLLEVLEEKIKVISFYLRIETSRRRSFQWLAGTDQS